MKKIVEKITAKNYKKSIIRLVILAVLFIAVTAGTCYGVFGNRLKDLADTMKQQEKKQEQLDENWKDSKISKGEDEHDNHFVKHKSEHEELSKSQIKSILNLSTKDKIVIGVFSSIAVLFAIYYWLLIVAITIKLAKKMNANITLFGWLALFTNLLALIILYLYKNTGYVCDQCGKVYWKKKNYCVACGNQMIKECSNCGTKIKKTDAYCNHCGKKVN